MIPELRIPITISTLNNNFQVDIGGGWLVATVTSKVWYPYFLGGYDTSGDTDCEEAATAAAGVAFTHTYNASGANRGKWTWAINAGTFALGSASEPLIGYFGFNQASYAAAASHTSDVESSYIFTPQYALRDQPTYLPLGYQDDKVEALAEQTVSNTGVVQTISGTSELGIRLVTFHALSESDVHWFRRVWSLIRDGRVFKLLQDRTVNTAYSSTNPSGYLLLVLDIESCLSFEIRESFQGTKGMWDIALRCRQYVAP